MNEKVLKYLYDIQLALVETDSFVASIPNDFKEYVRHPVIRRAVERNLEIIGEAVSRILKEDPNFPLENARRIIGIKKEDDAVL